MAARTLTLRNVPTALIDAIVDFALDEDRTPTAQAERLLREALTQHGRWPHGGTPSDDRSAALTTVSRDLEAVAG